MDVWHQGHVVLKVTWKSYVMIYILILKSIIAYLHGHTRMLIAILIILIMFEF